MSYAEKLPPTVVWESLKLDCKEILSNAIAFWKKQHNCELCGLHKSLWYVNLEIYQKGLTLLLEQE